MRLWAAICTVMLLASACDTDPLCTPVTGCRDNGHAGRQHITFDWSADPAASPQGMRVWLYPLDWQGDPIPVDLPGREGGDISVVPGQYRIAAYNNDSEWNLPDRTDDYTLHSLHTRDADLLGPLDPMAPARNAPDDVAARVAACPSRAWADSRARITVPDTGQVYLTPRPATALYRFRFTGIEGTQHVARASASISGMSAAFNLASLGHRGDLCTHPLAASPDTVKGEISGSFHTFGVPPGTGVPNRMALYVVMDDGSKYKYTRGDNLDVTSQIQHAPDPRHVTLVVGGIKLPGTQGAAGTFDPVVDDWQDERHDIII